jgi:GNAT superfamily N-acetyltransferase
MSIEVVEVKNKKDLKKFITFPWKVYKDDKHWVPPLISERMHFFDKTKNPYFNTANVSLFLAIEDGEIVGTISAHADYGYIKFWNEPSAFFGFFECLPEYRYAEVLFNTAISWAKRNGYKRILGPFNFNTNHECGLLIDGFDSDPIIEMTYNPRYYIDYYERFGFEKAKDLYAYFINAKQPPEYLDRIIEKIKQRGKINLRYVDLKHFNAEVDIIKEIYNKAWSRNWGFVPLTDQEFYFIAKSLKQIVEPELAMIAEVNNKPAGFSLSLPDYNVVAKAMNGRLFPFGIFKFLIAKRNIKFIRVFTLGVIPEYQYLGIGALLYYQTWKNGLKKGYQGAEMSWILEDNIQMNHAIKRIGGEIYKTYRIYSKQV